MAATATSLIRRRNSGYVRARLPAICHSLREAIVTIAPTIYINSPNHNDGQGSMQHFARSLIGIYSERGYDVVLCCSVPSRDTARCVHVPARLRTGRNRVDMVILYAFLLLDILKRRRSAFAIVDISHEFVFPLYLRKSLVIIHDTIQMAFPRRRGVKLLLATSWFLARRARWCVCVSRATQADVAALGIRAEVIYVPFARSALTDYLAGGTVAPDKTIDAIWCGTLAPHKDIATLIALARLDPGRRFCAILPPGDAAILAPGDCPANLDIRHSLGGSDYLDALRSARVLISTSLKEGYGMPAMEALTLGTPALLSDIAVYREIYGTSATFFAPGDPVDLRRQLNSVLAGAVPPSAGTDLAAFQGSLERYADGIGRLFTA